MNTEKLRSMPANVMFDEAKKIFNLTSRWNPKVFTDNSYELEGLTIIDHSTSLQWQKSGSDLLSVYEIESYIKKLNDDRYSGYEGWRLPTTEELLSLMEPEKQKNDLYINPLFDSKQYMCWGADEYKGYRYNVYFQKKRVYYDIKVSHYIRAVRNVTI